MTPASVCWTLNNGTRSTSTTTAAAPADDNMNPATKPISEAGCQIPYSRVQFLYTVFQLPKKNVQIHQNKKQKNVVTNRLKVSKSCTLQKIAT
jgi:hypothetical protein